MNIIPVDQIPKKRGYHKLQEMLEEFVKSPNDVVKVQIKEGEYKSPSSCVKSLYCAVKRSGYAIKIHMRGDDIYLEK